MTKNRLLMFKWTDSSKEQHIHFTAHVLEPASTVQLEKRFLSYNKQQGLSQG